MNRTQLIEQLEALFRSEQFSAANYNPAADHDRLEQLNSLGELWALLKGECEFDGDEFPHVALLYKGFDYFESLSDNPPKSAFYLRIPAPRKPTTAPPSAVKDDPANGLFTRSRLIQICQKAIVPEDKWRNRDSAQAQRQIGSTYAMLAAGFTYRICQDQGEWNGLVTDESTIWLDLLTPDGDGYDTAYLPTESRIVAKEGRDWY